MPEERRRLTFIDTEIFASLHVVSFHDKPRKQLGCACPHSVIPPFPNKNEKRKGLRIGDRDGRMSLGALSFRRWQPASPNRQSGL